MQSKFIFKKENIYQIDCINVENSTYFNGMFSGNINLSKSVRISEIIIDIYPLSMKELVISEIFFQI